MGLFSRDTKIYVSSVIYPLGEDPTKIPDIVKAGVIKAGFEGSSRAKAIDKAIFDGAGIKLAQGYNYARRHYYAGLPTGFPSIEAGPNDDQLTIIIKEYLDGIHSPLTNTVVLNSVTVSYGNNYDTRVRQLIESDYKYDFWEEECYQANNGIAVGAALEYEQLPDDDLNHPNDLGWRLTFTNPNLTTVVIDKWYLETLFLNQETVQNRIVYEYSLNGAPSVTAYYAFGGSDGRMNIFLRTLETPQSGTFPAIVLKKSISNKKRYYLDEDQFHGGTAAKTTAAWKTSKVYGDRMDIDIQSLIDKLRDNPDEKQIDYAFLQPGTMLNSPNTAVHEYHYRYFERLYTSFPNNKPAFDAWVAAYGNKVGRKSKAESCPAQYIHILDPDDTKASVNMIISWRYITYEVKSGALPKAYTVECGTQEFLNSSYDGGKAIKQVEFDATKIYFRKRLTESTYGELTVCGLWHENYVYKNKHIQSSGWAAFNDPDSDFGSGFILPLEYEVLIGLSARERLQLSQEAFHLVLNCYKIVKEKWYETGAFKVILAIVAIVVIVLSWGTLGPLIGGLYASVLAVIPFTVPLAVAAALAAIITATILAGISVGVSFVAKEAGEWAAEQWGPAWGAVVQIAAVALMTYGVGVGLEGLNVVNIPAATLPMQVANFSSMALIGLSTFTQFQMEELKQAQTQWNDYITSPNNPMEELKKLMDELFPENQIQHLAQQAVFSPKESLDQFLGRTLTLVDGLTYRLTMPITNFAELTLTPRLT